MAKCANCGTTILFGGVRDGERRFCNQKCHQQGQIVQLAGDVPEDEVRQLVFEVHNGLCPLCERTGPVDVHRAHKVWSAVIMTSWSSEPHVCCRSCGLKKQGGAMVYSLVLGWWGFPWGLVMTPVQVARNLAAMAKAPNPTQPSQELEAAMLLHIAVQRIAQQAEAQAADQQAREDADRFAGG